MANQLKMATVNAIRTLRERGWSQRRIARTLGVHRETVGRYQIIDKEMFALIEKLARAEHRDRIEALPDNVREKQRDRARQVRAAVRKRLG